MASSVADIDPEFQKRIDSMRTAAKENGNAIKDADNGVWTIPGQWKGSLFDVDALSAPFVREKPNQDFVKAITSKGTSGDCVASATQVDYTAAMERAFRARHTMRRPRAAAHAAGRLMGHGHTRGPFGQAVLDYLRGVIKQAKSGG